MKKDALQKLVDIALEEVRKKRASNATASDTSSDDDVKLELIRGFKRNFEIDEDISESESVRLDHDVVVVKPIIGRFEYILDFTSKKVRIASMQYGEIHSELSVEEFKDYINSEEKITADELNQYYKFMEWLGGDTTVLREREKTKGKGTGIGDDD